MINNVAPIYKLAVANEGSINSTWKDMLVFQFKTREQAARFADVTGGMIVRGLVSGAVDVAIIPKEA